MTPVCCRGRGKKKRYPGGFRPEPVILPLASSRAWGRALPTRRPEGYFKLALPPGGKRVFESITYEFLNYQAARHGEVDWQAGVRNVELERHGRGTDAVGAEQAGGEVPGVFAEVDLRQVG